MDRHWWTFNINNGNKFVTMDKQKYVINYRVLTGNTASALDKKVREFALEGWNPRGSHTVLETNRENRYAGAQQQGTNIYYEYAQTMTRKEPTYEEMNKPSMYSFLVSEVIMELRPCNWALEALTEREMGYILGYLSAWPSREIEYGENNRKSLILEIISDMDN